MIRSINTEKTFEKIRDIKLNKLGKEGKFFNVKKR